MSKILTCDLLIHFYTYVYGVYARHNSVLCWSVPSDNILLRLRYEIVSGAMKLCPSIG